MPNLGINLVNLTLSYQRRPAIHHITGVIPQGSLMAVMGPNGGGKSTFLKALAGLHPIDEGRIERSENQGLHQTAYLPQSILWDREFPLSVEELVSQALVPELGLWRRQRPEHKKRIDQALQQVGLTELKKKIIGQLSLGQFQRALFARVIVQNAQVVLLDEPLTGLDEPSVLEFFKLMHHWNQEGKTIVVVLHDRSLALEHFPMTMILAKEVQAWGPSKEVLRSEIWHKALTHTPFPLSEEECRR